LNIQQLRCDRRSAQSLHDRFKSRRSARIDIPAIYIVIYVVLVLLSYCCIELVGSMISGNVVLVDGLMIFSVIFDNQNNGTLLTLQIIMMDFIIWKRKRGVDKYSRDLLKDLISPQRKRRHLLGYVIQGLSLFVLSIGCRYISKISGASSWYYLAMTSSVQSA
jgi:hypothetical protein